jgi:hypothetical protein
MYSQYKKSHQKRDYYNSALEDYLNKEPIFSSQQNSKMGLYSNNPLYDPIKRNQAEELDLFAKNIAQKSEQSDMDHNAVISIYSKSGHIVQNVNTNEVTLPKSADISSILVIDSDGNVIPFTYVPATTLGLSLVDKRTGDKAEVTVLKDGKTTKGKVLSMDEKNITLLIGDDIVVVRKYDNVVVRASEETSRHKILLYENNGTIKKISYLLSNIRWDCVGTALIDNNTRKMYLRLAGNINNNTGSELSGKVFLISGEVYQSSKSNIGVYENEMAVPRASMKLARAHPLQSERVTGTSVEDYVKYDVGARTLHNQEIAELGIWEIPIVKLYVHKTSDNKVVKFGYRLTAPEFIPECSVNVFSINNEKDIDSYIGSSDIEESQKDDEIDLMLGETTLLKATSTIILSDVEIPDDVAVSKYQLKIPRKHHDRIWHLITEDLNVEIKNHNLVPGLLVIKHYIGSKRLINISCKSFKHRKNGYLEWYFEIPAAPNSTTPLVEIFECQIITAEYS